MWFSFNTSTKRVELQKVTRRIIDGTVPRHCFDDVRVVARSTRQLPAFVAVYKGGEEVGEVSNAVTKDISDTGLALLVPVKLDATEVVIALAFDGEPKFFLGAVRQNRSFGAGFWQLSLELTDILDPMDNAAARRLLPLVDHLKPQ